MLAAGFCENIINFVYIYTGFDEIQYFFLLTKLQMSAFFSISKKQLHHEWYISALYSVICSPEKNIKILLTEDMVKLKNKLWLLIYLLVLSEGPTSREWIFPFWFGLRPQINRCIHYWLKCSFWNSSIMILKHCKLREEISFITFRSEWQCLSMH